MPGYAVDTGAQRYAGIKGINSMIFALLGSGSGVCVTPTRLLGCSRAALID